MSVLNSGGGEIVWLWIMGGNHMGVSGFIWLRIIADELDFQELGVKIDLHPTNTFRKGENTNSRFGNETFEQDGWFFELEFKDADSFDAVLNEFSTKLVGYKDYLQDLYKKAYVRLWCDLYSDNAQMGFEISPETLSIICSLGIGFDISFFAHGDVE